MDAKEFKPDWRSAPGETIVDLMVERGMPPEHLASALGMTDTDFDSFLRGGIPLTEQHAGLLAKIFGNSKAFWINREAHYREPMDETTAEILARMEVFATNVNLIRSIHITGTEQHLADIQEITKRLEAVQAKAEYWPHVNDDLDSSYIPNFIAPVCGDDILEILDPARLAQGGGE